MRFEDKRVIVTGASRGLGLGLVRGLVRRGARVVAVARDVRVLQDAVAPLLGNDTTGGGPVWAMPADVGAPEAAARIVGHATAVLGRVDALVNNASTLGPLPMGLLADASDEDWRQVLQVNLLGPARLIRSAMAAMARQGEGLIVNISSDAAHHAYPTWGLYGTSKAALDHMTAIWRSETAEHGVVMTAVDPGEMNTVMHAEALPDADRSSLGDPDDVAERILARLEQGSVSARWSVAS